MHERWSSALASSYRAECATAQRRRLGFGMASTSHLNERAAEKSGPRARPVMAVNRRGLDYKSCNVESGSSLAYNKTDSVLIRLIFLLL